jgi:hypothetical protein
MVQRRLGDRLGIEEDVDEILGRLAYAIRTDDPEDACAGLLETVRSGCASLRTLPPREAWRRVSEVAGALGVPSANPGDPGEAAGLTPAGGYRLPLPAGPALAGPSPWERGPEGRLPIQEDLLELSTHLPGVDPGALDMLRELARVRVPPEQGGVRFFVALVRALDQVTWDARYLPHEEDVRERVRPLLARAVRRAREQGAKVYPQPGEGRLDARAPCPVRELPAFGSPRGELTHVDRHGFVLPEGRVEEAVVRVARGPAPPFWPLLLEGYRALLARRGEGPNPTTYRAWLDELAGLEDGERQATTVRYAATAVHALGPGSTALYQRFLSALEGLGSFQIPLVEHRLHDEERYDVLLQPGTGTPRLIRPGFQGPSGLVQQRARVVADPSSIGSGG